MRWLLVVLLMTLASCSPVQQSREYQTKYPDSATMGAAADANTKTFNEHSFDK